MGEETAGKPRKPLKVGLAAFPERYALPSRPTAVMPTVADAHRQTGFLLADDLGLFEQAMNVQLRLVAANAKARTAGAAAILSPWSRTFSHLADACTLMTLGSYASCMPVLRSACDCIAVQRSLVRDGFGEYDEWFGGAIAQDREHGGLAFDTGRYRAASVFAENERLGTAYRALTELSMPHFGATAFLTGADSSLQKLSLAFGDSAFHYGWAELICGWLLQFAVEQTALALECGVLATPRDVTAEAAGLIREVEAALEGRRRCYVEDDGGRFVFYNFRRTASGQPKRVVLG